MFAVRVPLLAVFGLCSLLTTVVVSGQQEQRSIGITTQFLTKALMKAAADDDFNYVSSPFASSVILALLAEGAESETKNQLVETLGGNLPDKNTYKELLTSTKGYSSDGSIQNKLVLKNFVYVFKNYSVLESFADLARDYYLADVRSVARPDLEVLRATYDDPNTPVNDDVTAFKEYAMLIFNGFSLELSWPTSTWHKTSVTWNGNVIRAFGAAGNFAIGQIPSIDCTVFQLPYKNTDYALLVLLPENKGNLNEVLKNLPENGIKDLTKTMSMRPGFVTMPCFKSSNITHLKTVLQEQTTVNSVFTDSADLTKMTADKLYLDDVVQQAGFRVCVGGSSSHSLTSSAFTSQRVIKESVVVDRPFAYVLYNTVNGVAYVTGKVDVPVWDADDDDDDDSASTEAVGV